MTPKTFAAIHSSVRKFFPDNLKASHARHLNTLAALVCGIIRSQNVHLPQITRKVPGGSAGYAHWASKSASRTKLFYRWMKNEKVTHEICFLPFAQKILNALAHAPLVMVKDGTAVGRDCMALVIAVVYKPGSCLQHLIEEKYSDALNLKESSCPLCRRPPSDNAGQWLYLSASLLNRAVSAPNPSVRPSFEQRSIARSVHSLRGSPAEHGSPSVRQGSGRALSLQ
jgi:hypothetical protein